MRILMVTENLPYPPVGGHRIKILSLLKELSKRHEIYLFSFTYPHEHECIDGVKMFCKHFDFVPHKKIKMKALKAFLNIFEKEPFSLKQFDFEEMSFRINSFLAINKLDLIHLDLPNTSKLLNNINYTNMPFVIAPNDSVYSNLRVRMLYEKNFFMKIYYYSQWKKWKSYEASIYPKFDQCIVVSEAEKETLLELSPKIKTVVAPLGVDAEYFKALNLVPDGPSLVFTGSMSGFQSYNATAYFYKNVYLRVKTLFPNIRLYLVGKDPHPTIKRLSQDSSVIVTGFVDDIRPYIDKSTIYICPLRIGSGIKTRVLEAMAMGKPIVSFREGCSGIEVTNKDNVIIVNTSNEFIRWIITLLNDEKLRARLGDNARKLVESNYTWEKTANIIESAYLEAIENRKT